MKSFSRIETMQNEGQFDRAMKRRDQLILVEFVSVRARDESNERERGARKESGRCNRRRRRANGRRADDPGMRSGQRKGTR